MPGCPAASATRGSVWRWSRSVRRSAAGFPAVFCVVGCCVRRRRRRGAASSAAIFLTGAFCSPGGRQPMPRNQQTGRQWPGNTVSPAAPRPLYGPWVLASALRAVARTASGNLDHLLRRRSEGWNSPDHRRTPNPRAADSVRSGKVDAPTPKNERFRRSEACAGGAGGTRTHGRRIMSPLRILAVLADQRSSLSFSQVRRADQCLVPCGPCRSVPVLVAPQWPLGVDELGAYHSSSHVRPVQPRGWNPSRSGVPYRRR